MVKFRGKNSLEQFESIRALKVQIECWVRKR